MTAVPLLDRRRLLALSGGAALAGCAMPTRPGFRSALGPGTACPPPVRVAPERVIRSVAGLRPYRKSGFVVRTEAVAGKRVVHNYGHGGGGVTLSWGTSRLATELGLPGHSGPVAVLGAGVMGLTTARLVVEAGLPVTVYAAALPPETTSNIAGGQWWPASVFDEDAATPAFLAQYVAAADYAYRRFQLLTGDEYGVRWMRNFYLSDHPFRGDPGRDRLAAMQPEARELSPDEHPFPYPYARQVDSLIVEPPRFLRAMERDVRIAGGRFVIGKITPQDLPRLPETLVFNCTGLGARELFGDGELVPVRGQLAVLMPQPELDYALLGPGGLYMFPRADGVILGGTFEHGAEVAQPEPERIARIVDGHRRLFAGWRACH